MPTPNKMRSPVVPFKALRRLGIFLPEVARKLRALKGETSLKDWEAKLVLQLADRHIGIKDVADKLTRQEYRRDGSLVGATILINGWIQTILSDYLFKFKYLTTPPTAEEAAATRVAREEEEQRRALLSPEELKRLEEKEAAEAAAEEARLDAEMAAWEDSIEAKEHEEELAATLRSNWDQEIPSYLMGPENEDGEDNRDALKGFKIFKVDAKHPSLNRSIKGHSLRRLGDGLYDEDDIPDDEPDDEPRPRKSGKKRRKRLAKRRKRPLEPKNEVVANKGT